MTYRDALALLADPTRRSILETLATDPRSVADLARDLPVSRPAVSQHLKALSDAGLVEVRAEGTRRIYSVSPAALAELRQWLDRLWGDALESFAKAAKEAGPHDH